MAEKYEGKTFRLAIVGSAAGIAATHLKAIQQIKEIKIVGMADVAAEKGAARAKEYDSPFFTDHKKMLAETKPEIVVITTPHPFHPSVAVDAFAAGAHVLTEKPLAVSVSEADTMIQAADKAGKILAINFQLRFQPVVEKAKALVASGAIGSLIRLLCVEPWYRPAAYYRSASWRGTWAGEGGGVLMNQSPHTMDLLCHLVGPPAKVTGWVRTRFHAMECEDSAQAMFEYGNGAPGYFTVSTIEAGVERRIQVVGDKGALEIAGNRLQVYKFDPSLSEHRASATEMFSSPKVEVETPQVAEGGGDHLAVYKDLLNALVEGRQPRANGREALMSLELANAIVLSSFQEKTVTLPLDRAAYRALLEDLKAGKKKTSK